jgi:hypothetical protein
VRRGRATVLVLAVALAVLAAACDSSSGGDAPKPPPESAVYRAACAGTLRPSSPGTLASDEMDESSGLAVSAENPGTLWINNDSGDTARVFAVATTGALRGIYDLAGATAVDWEDVALGPGPRRDTPYLYVGDTGDNAEGRANVVVYRVPEPTVTGDGGTHTLDGVEALTLRYPDGAHDSEALMVDPRDGDLYLIAKHLLGGDAGIYRAPSGLAAGSTTVLTHVGDLKLGFGLPNAVTAADISREGSTIAVRTYGAVRLWHRDTRTVVATLATKPCPGPTPVEVQGEAVGLAPGGRSYFTVSEGVHAPLHQFSAPN